MSFMLRSVSKVVSTFKDKSNEQICVKLLEACKNGDIETVNKCLSVKKDFDINYECQRTGFTPLKYACYYGHYEIVNMLIKRNGIKLDFCGEYFDAKNSGEVEAPLHIAVAQWHQDQTKYTKIIELLYQNGADINIQTTSFYNTPIFMAIKMENVDLFKYLLAKPEILINIRNGFKWNALHFVAFYNKKQTEIMQRLLEEGVRINAKTRDGSTALHLCIHSWPMIENNPIQQEKIKLLIRFGADINKQDQLKKTALDYCSNEYKMYFLEYAKQYEHKIKQLLEEEEKEVMEVLYPKSKHKLKGQLDEEEKDAMELYPTPNSKDLQKILIQENDKLKTEVAKLQEQMETLIKDKERNGENEREMIGSEGENDDDRYGTMNQADIDTVEDENEAEEQTMEYVEFIEWLTHKVKLKQYLKNFEDEGWCDIRLVPDINEEELVKLGIEKSGHRRIILREVERYKVELEQEREAEGVPYVNGE